MYKIMIHIDTHTNDTWFYYQEEGKDYVANSLEEIRETVLTLIDVYGEDYIKIVKQETGDDMSGSVETFLYDSTDNYEELVNRPFINGVEIVGALSLVELGIQPVGNYAANERVDALEEMVNNIDLDPYATNERVDQVEAKVDAIDLEPYATMDYLDEVVAGIDFSASNENITGVKTFSVLPRSTVVPVTEDELTNKAYVDHEVLDCASETYVDEAIANIKIPMFEVASLGAAQYDAYMTEEEGKRFLEYCNEHYNEFVQVYLYCPTLSLSGIYSGTPVANAWGNGIFKLYSNATGYKSGIIYSTYLYVNANMTEDSKFDTTQSCRPYIHCETMLNVSANYLSRTNTREYTPTTAYHPATKKYVDDAIAEIPTGPNNIIKLTGAYDFFKNYDLSYLKFNDTDLLLLQNYINNNYDGVNPESLLPLNIINNITKSYSNAQNIIITDVKISGSNISFTGHIYYTNEAMGINNSPYVKIYDISLFATYTETNGVYTISMVGFRTRPREVDCLIINNTKAYTPIGDYNPATKKYVDDAVANIDVPDVDLTDYYNKTEVDNKISEMLSSAITNTLEGGY